MIYANISKNFLGEFHLLYKIYCTKELSTKLSRRLFGVDSNNFCFHDKYNYLIGNNNKKNIIRKILTFDRLYITDTYVRGSKEEEYDGRLLYLLWVIGISDLFTNPFKIGQV